MLKRKIVDALTKATGVTDIELEIPENEGFGDYSSNIAMAMFSKSKIKNQKSKINSPKKLADDIVKKLRRDTKLAKLVDKIEVGGGGFINFCIKSPALLENLGAILDKKEDYGRSRTLKNKKIIVEFTDPNPFKEFHIGHLYTNTIGEAICRILEANGAVVKRANYQGDVGLHVAKSIWGLLKKITDSGLQISDLEKMNLEERVKFMGEAYALGAKAYEEDEKAKEEITALNKKIFENDPEVNLLYQKGRSWSLEYFEKIYARLGTKFDFYYFESEVGKTGEEIVKENLKRGVFESSQGAVIFPGEKYGLHDRVFINSLGLPTYEAKELGLAPTKYKDFAYDESIIITGNEINEYFKVLIKAMSLVFPDLGAKTKHLGHGMVRLPGGKMGSRTGNVVVAEELLDEVKGRVLKVMKTSDVAGAEKEDIAEKVTVGAVKYSLLRSSIGQDIIFDLERSLSLQGESGPYLQYTFARTQSVLRKAIGNRQEAPASPSEARRAISNKQLTINNFNLEELSLLRSLVHFPEVVELATSSLSPNLLCNYLFDLAQKYNNFYNQHRILDAKSKRVEEQESLRNLRIALTAAVGQVLKNGLGLLGILTPERM